LLDKFPHFALGIGGVLTYKKSTLPAVLRSQVPLDRIVVETDAPYLTPHPHRGKRNEPSYIPHIVEKLAEVYEQPIDEVYQTLLETSQRIFPRLK
ncbi:MAG: TatD family hydrolase, partial [Bacteroidaceae bacterium]|nr:TatD family hydrolase [Bacteroidaceae bacterium]